MIVPEPITFTVWGTAVPQGSMTAVKTAKMQHAQVIPANKKKLLAWRKQVLEATPPILKGYPLEGPVRVTATFWFVPPKKRPKDRTHPSVRPDVDKLARAILDALTGPFFKDDAQVTSLFAMKRYGEKAATVITVEPELDDPVAEE